MSLRKSRIGKAPTFHVEQLVASEEQESQAFWDCCQFMPAIKELIVHFANEGKRSVGYARRLKRVGGLPKGFPDYAIFLSNEKYSSLFIEMKKVSERGKKLRPEQLMWRDRLLKAGHYAIIIYGCDEGIKVVNDYLQNKL